MPCTMTACLIDVPASVEALRTEGALDEFLTEQELDPSAADTGPLNLIN
jgi:hypothetical protein